MELKDFVKSVLEDVTQAVDESSNNKFQFDLQESTNAGIEFDLAVVLKKSADGKVGAEIFSVIGAKAEGKISEEKVNRIKFMVLNYRKKN